MSDRDPQHLKSYAVAIYALYLIPAGVAALVGMVLAYLKMGMGGPGPDSHFVYQIRTFWIGCFYALLGAAMIPFGLATTVWLLAAMWFCARAAIGLIKALHNEPLPSPRSWFLGL